MIVLENRNSYLMMFVITLSDLIFGIIDLRIPLIISSSIFIIIILICRCKFQSQGQKNYTIQSSKLKKILEEAIILYYCCSSLIFNGIPYFWFSMFSVSLDCKLCQFIIIPFSIAFYLANIQPLYNTTSSYVLIQEGLLFGLQLFNKYQLTQIKFQAKSEIIQTILQYTTFKYFDQNNNEIENNENRNISEQDGTLHTAICSARTEKIQFQQKLDLEFKIKCYSNNIKDYHSMNLQTFIAKPLQFNNIKDFLQAFIKDEQDFIDNVIIATETDQFQGTKQQYKLLIKQIKHLNKKYIIVAFIRLDFYYQQKYLNFIFKFKNTLSKIFTHKLKTPLNTTLGMLQTAVLENNNIEEQTKETILKPAFINSKIQCYSIYDLLDYINQNDKVQLKLAQINLQKILKLIQYLIALQCKAKNIKFIITLNGNTFQYDDKKNYYMFTDQLGLERILFNLLNKSYRHNERDGTIMLNLNIDEENNKIYFSITDNFFSQSDNYINFINEQALYQHQSCLGFIQSQNKNKLYKFGLQLQITNKLIYQLSEGQCSLQIKRNQEYGVSYHFFLSLTCTKTSLFECHQTQSFKYMCQDGIQKQYYLHSQVINNEKYLESNNEQLPNEPLANKPLFLSTQIQGTPKSQFINSSILAGNGLPIVKSIYLRELVNKCSTSQRQIDHSFNLIKKIQDSIDIRQDLNQTILLVDDEPFNHDTLKLLLRTLGFINFMSAFNGQECIEIVKKHHKIIKVIFMDLDMPIMNGIQSTKILIEMMKKNEIDCIPISACTAHDDNDTEQQCNEAGMSFILAKPVFLRSLQEAFVMINEIKQKAQLQLLGSKIASESVKL